MVTIFTFPGKMSHHSISTSTSESVESDLSEEEKVSMENFALLRVLGKGGKAFFVLFFGDLNVLRE